MTREERELSIEYLEKIKEDYIEGNAYERHPLPEYYAIENAIKALKQEAKWIPVTERIPDKLTNVNIAFDDCPNEYDVAYLRTTVNETYRKNGAENEWVSLMGEATYADYEVSAWMEIKPYKTESEVEDRNDD